MKKISTSQVNKKKSTSQILGDLELYDKFSFDLSVYKYSSVSATLQRKQIDTGRKFTQLKKENILTVRRTA